MQLECTLFLIPSSTEKKNGGKHTDWRMVLSLLARHSWWTQFVSFICCVVASGLSGRQQLDMSSRVAAITMWCHKDWTLTQRNCLRLYQRMIVLLLSTGLFSTTLRPRVADLCSNNHRTRIRGTNLQPVAFLSFISSKEVLLSPQSELSQPR